MKRKLILKKGISDYKSPETYLRQIYKTFKDEITAGLSEALDIENAANKEYLKKNLYQVFKDNIKDLGGGKITLSAIKKYEQSTLFKTYKNRVFDNIRTALRNEGLWEDFRRLNGRQRWEEDRLEYMGNGTYTYHGVRGDIVISFENSPENIIMYKVQKDTETK